ATSKRPRCAIVALTASAFEHDRPAILAVGCDAVIAKPFDERGIFDELAKRLGVRYLVELAAEQRVPLALDAIPADSLATLSTALLAGDDAAALAAIERFAAVDGSLAAELVRRIKAFDFDSILVALEASRR